LNNIKITKLGSGVHIISEELPYVKSFSLGFWFNVGSRDETKANNGISHFLEHMFFKGTKKRSAKKISEEIESVGGYLNAFTSKEHTCFYGRGLYNHLEKTFSVLSDMIQNSLFDEKELMKESRVVIDEMKDIEDSPEELVFDKFENVIYGNGKLGLPIIGTEKNLKKFRSADLFKYISSRYGNGKLFIVASGAVKHDALIKLAGKYLTKDFGRKPKRKEEKYEESSGNVFVPKTIQQSHLIVGRTAPGYSDDTRIQASLLSHILGEGSSSRLFYRIREKNGIAYQVNSFLNSFYDVSSFGVYLSTNEESIKKARDLIFQEFEKIKRKKIGAAELKKAKEYLRGSLLMSLESTTNRMNRIAQSFIYFNEFKTVEDSIAKIEAVKIDEIYETANQLLDERKMTTVVISDKNILDGEVDD